MSALTSTPSARPWRSGRSRTAAGCTSNPELSRRELGTQEYLRARLAEIPGHRAARRRVGHRARGGAARRKAGAARRLPRRHGRAADHRGDRAALRLDRDRLARGRQVGVMHACGHDSTPRSCWGSRASSPSSRGTAGERPLLPRAGGGGGEGADTPIKGGALERRRAAGGDLRHPRQPRQPYGQVGWCSGCASANVDDFR